MQTELAIVGAGPAGMAAAEVAADHGVHVTLIDEQPTPGGQFLRQPPVGWKVSGWLDGAAYRAGKELLGRVSADRRPEWIMQTSVAGIFVVDDGGDGRFTLLLEDSGSDGGTRQLKTDAVLIAAGCFDLPVVFPGWNLPGVMAAGGIQAFVKSQQFVPGKRFLFAGSHPLQLVVAGQIVQAGGSVAGVLFAQSRRRALELLKHPSVALRASDKLVETAALLRRLRTAGVPVRFGRTVLRANGQDSLESVTTVPVGPDGRFDRKAAEDIDCDQLGVCFGFLSSSELARQAGVDCRWAPSRGGWIAEHDATMASSVAGIYVAGETTGVAGSDVAALEGRIAGLACAVELGRLDAGRARILMRVPARRLQQSNRFARFLADLSWPGHTLFDQLMTDPATLCKCEEVKVGTLRYQLEQNPGMTTASAVKLFSRVGMGLCQGRYCHFALTRLMAGHLGVPEDSVGGFTSRFPAKPVSIESLIGHAGVAPTGPAGRASLLRSSAAVAPRPPAAVGPGA